MILEQHFDLVAGDYQLLQIDVVNDAEAPYPNLEDGVLNWYLTHPPHVEPLIEKTSVEDPETHYIGITIPSPGIVLVEILGTDTDDFDEGEYYHKLTWTLAGKTKTAATGVATIYQNGSEYFKV